MAQKEILDLLRSIAKPLPRRDIAEHLKMDPKQVSRFLKQLIRSGLVKFDYNFDPIVKKKIWFYSAVVIS